MTGEELLLVIPTGGPSEDVSHGKAFAARLADHGFRRDTFGWTGVMCTAAGMNMGVTRVPSPFRRIDPALQFHFDACVAGIDGDRLRAGQVFGTAPALDGLFSVGQQNGLAVAAVDLRLEKEIRRHSHRLRRIDPILPIFDRKGSDTATTVSIAYS